jgi:hypothetical protein
MPQRNADVFQIPVTEMAKYRSSAWRAAALPLRVRRCPTRKVSQPGG